MVDPPALALSGPCGHWDPLRRQPPSTGSWFHVLPGCSLGRKRLPAASQQLREQAAFPASRMGHSFYLCSLHLKVFSPEWKAAEVTGMYKMYKSKHV